MIRIPALLQTGTGALLAFAVGRRGSGGDYGWNDLLLRRSLDGGATWEPAQLVHGEAAAATIDNPCPIWDARRNATVLLYACRARCMFHHFIPQREHKNQSAVLPSMHHHRVRGKPLDTIRSRMVRVTTLLLVRAHTHTHSLTHTHVRTYAHTRITRTHAHTHTHTRTRAHMRTRTHKHTRARAHTHTHARTRTQSHTHTHK